MFRGPFLSPAYSYFRYHIHEYNVDDLMMCIIPYHETKVFVRVIQLMSLSNQTNKWNWLEPCAVSLHSLFPSSQVLFTLVKKHVKLYPIVSCMESFQSNVNFT